MDEDDLRREIVRLEARIEALAETIERCREADADLQGRRRRWRTVDPGRAVGAIRFDPVLMIVAMAAVIGGVVLIGSNGSTSEEATAALRTAEAERAELIGKIELHVVGEGAGGNLPETRAR